MILLLSSDSTKLVARLQTHYKIPKNIQPIEKICNLASNNIFSASSHHRQSTVNCPLECKSYIGAAEIKQETSTNQKPWYGRKFHPTRGPLERSATQLYLYESLQYSTFLGSRTFCTDFHIIKSVWSIGYIEVTKVMISKKQILFFFLD